LIVATLTATQRRAIVTTARRWVGTPYSNRYVVGWHDLEQQPTAFDSATFVCRVAIEALDHVPRAYVPSATWLLLSLVAVDAPQLGDVVAVHHEAWHVMIYAGGGAVVGACELAGEVAIVPFDRLRHRARFDGEPAYRALVLKAPPT